MNEPENEVVEEEEEAEEDPAEVALNQKHDSMLQRELSRQLDHQLQSGPTYSTKEGNGTAAVAAAAAASEPDEAEPPTV